MNPDDLASYSGENPSIKTKIVEFIQTLVVFLAIGTVIYFFVARPHKVYGSSMFPNFQSGDYIITNELKYRFIAPARGDVIVFKNPRDTSQDFIKRIIGLPGEKVKVLDGHTYVNGQLLPEPYLKSSIVTEPKSFLQDGQDVEVPPDQYIVFGDNRQFSSDSREWGFINKDEIIGQAFFRYWPAGDIGIIPGVKY